VLRAGLHLAGTPVWDLTDARGLIHMDIWPGVPVRVSVCLQAYLFVGWGCGYLVHMGLAPVYWMVGAMGSNRVQRTGRESWFYTSQLWM
jgi:hypothetical protein